MTDINHRIDHTLLKPLATHQDIDRLCKEALEHNFKAVCIPPYYLDQCKKILDTSEVKIATVVGFPFGYDHLSTKMESVNKAILHGAHEIDAVVNISAVKNNDWAYVEREIDSLVTITQLKHNKILKLIFETCYLESQEVEALCNFCIKYGVSYAKTSTGYGTRGVTVEEVTLMRKFLEGRVKIKASGGIKDRDFALKLISAGADRLGTSSSLNLIKL